MGKGCWCYRSPSSLLSAFCGCRFLWGGGMNWLKLYLYNEQIWIYYFWPWGGMGIPRELVLKGVGGKSYVKPGKSCAPPWHSPSTRSARPGRRWLVVVGFLCFCCGSSCHSLALRAHHESLQGKEGWLKPPPWSLSGDRSSNTKYIKAHDWRSLGFPLGAPALL